MRQQIFTPCRQYRRFEGQHQHFAPAHFFGELVGGEGFAKAHFGIPEEMRGDAFFPLKIAKIGGGFFHRLALLRAHREILRVMRMRCQRFVLFFCQKSRLHVFQAASKPFAVFLLEAPRPQTLVNGVIVKKAAIVTQGGFIKNDCIRLLRQFDRILLRHALRHLALGVAYFQTARIAGVGVGVNAGNIFRGDGKVGHRVSP